MNRLSTLKDKSELGTRKRVDVTVTADVAIIPTDDNSTADVAIVLTNDGHMYVQLKNIACMCVYLLSVFNFSQHYPANTDIKNYGP